MVASHYSDGGVRHPPTRVLYKKVKLLSKRVSRKKYSMQRGIRREVLGRTKGEIKNSRSSSTNRGDNRQEEDKGDVPTSETRLPSRPLDEFSPMSWESSV